MLCTGVNPIHKQDALHFCAQTQLHPMASPSKSPYRKRNFYDLFVQNDKSMALVFVFMNTGAS